MTVNASDRTLGLISIWQVLRKLFWEIELIKATPNSLRVGVKPIDVLHVQDARLYATVNAASTSLALVDWLYHTLREDQALAARFKEYFGEADLRSDRKLLEFLRKANPSINACHQICNANKHFYLRSPDREFKATVFEFVMERSDGTVDISVSPHIMRNGGECSTVLPVFDMLETLANWWETLLTHIQVPGRDQFFPQPASEQG